jgi:arabinose-5-phosphate isomerase
MLAATRVVVTGMGKSGCVGQKVAATLSSTGTPACFLHPAEAAHGDLGMITADDAVLAFSWSGETPELVDIVSYAKRFRVPFIAVTSDKNSALGRVADIVIELPQAQEGCPFGLAPTTSAIMQLATGDCLAIALLEARGFTKERFRDFHPGGKLGAKLKRVRDFMHTGNKLPLVKCGTSVGDALLEMTRKASAALA